MLVPLSGRSKPSAPCNKGTGLEVHHGIMEPALYTFDYSEVLRWIAAQPDDTDSLALVGHNPASLN